MLDRVRLFLMRGFAAGLALAFVAVSPAFVLAQGETLPDIGIDMSAWVTAITGSWFALVATVLGFVFIAAITWKGVAMLKRRLTPTR